MNMRTEKKIKKDYTLIILDESGSMASVKKETISGVNEQLQELRKPSETENYVSLVTFNRTVRTLFWNKLATEVEDLTDAMYNPDGMTSMYDAVGQSVGRLRNELKHSQDDNTALVLIVSDGLENTSVEFTAESVQKIMSECKDDKAWTVTYMGANQDLSVISKTLDIPLGNFMLYDNSDVGTTSAFRKMREGISYRKSAGSSDATKSAFYSSIGGSATHISG